MGNGSPQLRSQLALRTAVLALASLVFAPPAFAEGGAIGVPSPDVGAVIANVAIPPAPATPVATPPGTPLLQPQATTAATTTRVARRMLVRPQAPRLLHRAPTARTKFPQRLSSAPSLPRVISSPREASSHGSAEPMVPPGSNPTPAPPAPRLPLPLPFAIGLGGMSWASAAHGSGLLLLALAAALALGGLPRLGRRVSLLIAAPRPYPYLLPLERPD